MSADDLLRVTRLVTDMGGLDHQVWARVLDGAPYSKSRPRFSRSGHTYVKEADREAESRTADQLRDMLDEPAPGNVALACIFYRPNFQRIDVDNMLKHVCDAATGVLWTDDSQCTALLGVAELDAQRPRTVLALAPHVSTLLRGTDATYPCAICGAPIQRRGQSKLRKTCSRACSAKARGYVSLDEPVPCPTCEQPFKRTTTEQRYCSKECAWASRRNIRREKAEPPMRCPSCGVALVHRRGGRCRTCWCADPSGTAVPVQGVLL